MQCVLVEYTRRDTDKLGAPVKIRLSFPGACLPIMVVRGAAARQVIAGQGRKKDKPLTELRGRSV